MKAVETTRNEPSNSGPCKQMQSLSSGTVVPLEKVKFEPEALSRNTFHSSLG